MSEKYRHLKVKELQELLEKNGLSQTGKKEELIERLVDYDKRKELEKLEKEFNLDEFTDPKLHSFDILKESVLSDDDDLLDDELMTPLPTTTTATKPATTPTTSTEKTTTTATTKATTNESKQEQPAFKFTPITFEKKASAKKETSISDQAKLDAQKKLERMKRFGVKLSEEEMKQIRAARFGTLNEQKKQDVTTKTNKKVEQGKVTKKIKTPIKKNLSTLNKKPINIDRIVDKLNKTQLAAKKDKKHDARTIVFENGKRNKDKKKTADHTTQGRIVTIDHATPQPNRAVKIQKNKHASPFVNKKRNVFIQQEKAQNSKFKRRRT
ncbi:uncharacterized protein RHIMIDRAFT_235849 [Rhizopus microsporus ATCC 52813]|uniref:SAP domain-containing protein n=1 Tax=Rhizopus microsporus ATCC 52813 TaxID=1340429 RepID=A0A2G4SYN6_RHIZD|nr:uncharacterized protein RHIMIDRAFT_235849 [Rhizopus microsporus ATCC 52813]PHZ13857.1 hypothetical protein RHIMIDRAFT_235849 [Rhizopus microsporus ATCC 52813]